MGNFNKARKPLKGAAIAALLGLSFQGQAEAWGLPEKSWYEGPTEGWSWYKDPVKPVLPPKKKEKPQRDKPGKAETESPSNAYVYTRQMETLRKNFDEAVSRAVLFPTLENVSEAQRLHNQIVERATAFQNVWMVSSLVSANGYRESDQASPQHRKIWREKEEQQLDQDIQELSKTWGLFFLFKKDCSYCHQMAPVVKEFQSRYRFAIKAISLDGDPIEGFEEAVVKDNGTIPKINPEGIFPVLFLVNPHTGQAIPIAKGLTSPSELKANVKYIIQYLKEHPNA